MKMLIKLIILLISVPVYTQTFEVDTLYLNGSIDSRINIVVLGDGYLESELDSFDIHARRFIDYFFEEEPFNNYRNYFNVFTIKTPSNVSGAAMDPSKLIDNYYGSTFNSGGIDRLLVPTKYARITGALSSNFPQYDQVIMLVNSTKYGGSGGWVATSSVNAAAGEIVLHEVGHSIAGLADEYYAGDQYARERVNMTKETDPVMVKWKNWYGDFGVGIYQHCCGGNSAEWYRPHENCLMRSLGRAFCPVCLQTVITRIHKLTSPLESFTPTSETLEPDSFPVTFNIQLVKPLENSLKIEWVLNSGQINLNSESIDIEKNELSEGSNSLIVYIRDTTENIRIDNYDTIDVQSVRWTINNIPSGVKDITGNYSNMRLFLYPNPATESIHIKFEELPKPYMSVSLINISGQTVKSFKAGEIYSTDFTIDLSDLPGGAYILSIMENGYPVVSRKVVKE